MQVLFGEFVLDLDARELRRGTDAVRLSPKAFQLLEILVTNRPKALSKADLQERLWPDTFVVEKNLANLVSEIRQALGDSSAGFIRTVPRFGYAFQDTAAPAPEPRAEHLSPLTAKHTALGVAGVALLVIVALASASLILAPSRTPNRIMLAVLPFQNLTGDPDQEYLCDGLTEEMIAQLGTLDPSRLGVIARTSAAQYKNTSRRADEIGRELGVQYLLETSVRRTNGRILIAAQLIDVKSQTHVWAEQHEHEMRDIVVLQRDVAAAITRRISGTLALEPRQGTPAPRHTTNDIAYEHYLRGRWHLSKDTAEGLHKARDHFQQAIVLDHAYALAHAGLGDTYALLGSYALMPISESHPLGRAAATRALELNESLAEAHSALAAIVADYYWDWPLAERHFQRAIDLAPDYVNGLRAYSFYLAYTGRSAAALPLAQRAIALDPLSLMAQVNLGVVLNMARRYRDASAHLERTLELDPNFPLAHAMLGLSYAYQRTPERAVSQLARARSTGGTRPDLIALHGYTLARAGRRSEALAVLDELHRLSPSQGPPPFQVAVVYVGLGDTNRAFEWLRKAVEARAWELPMLKADPIFDPLRSDPRFVSLLGRLGLPL